MFSQPSAPSERMGLGSGLQPQRTCGNGELVDINRDSTQPTLAMPPPAARPEAIQGNTTGFGFRDAGSR
jgi:hypothetical protein